MDEDLQNLEHPDPKKRPPYLPLAPPYHLLPNTSFFRRASIKPPPTYSTVGLSPLKRIINRYLISILVDQVKSESDLKLIFDDVGHNNIAQNAVPKLNERGIRQRDVENEHKRTEYDNQHNYIEWRKTSRVFVHHLYYGGHITHYVPNDCGFTAPFSQTFVPLVHENIATELYDNIPSKYQQQRTTSGFIYVPIIEATKDADSKMPYSPLPSPQLRLTGTAYVANFESTKHTSLNKEFKSIKGMVPLFDAVALKRYAFLLCQQALQA